MKNIKKSIFFIFKRDMQTYIMKGLWNSIICFAYDNQLKSVYSNNSLICTYNKHIPSSYIDIFDKRPPQFIVIKDHN